MTEYEKVQQQYEALDPCKRAIFRSILDMVALLLDLSK